MGGNNDAAKQTFVVACHVGSRNGQQKEIGRLAEIQCELPTGVRSTVVDRVDNAVVSVVFVAEKCGAGGEIFCLGGGGGAGSETCFLGGGGGVVGGGGDGVHSFGLRECFGMVVVVK